MIIKKKEDEVIVIPEGKIDFSNAEDFKENVLNIYNEGYRKIIIDLSNVSTIDSSGLGKILLFHKKLQEKDGELIIRNITSDYVRKMFNMINLDKIINIDGIN